ncbi:MAG: hypothetical protein IJN96_02980 [Clostridia bacterium]|nr:hypothetical protein [Clostridia bacterium]
MNFGTETGKRRIVLELFENSFEVFVDESSIVFACSEIRENILAKLRVMKESEDESEEVLENVRSFLKECLAELIGEDVVEKMEGYSELSLPEITGALCYTISEIGAVFVTNSAETAGDDDDN